MELPFASGGVIADQKPVMVGETVTDFFVPREVAKRMEALANPGVALNVEEPLRPGADFHLRFAVATAALLVVLGLGALLMWH
jgi:hypothetical protein